MSILPIEKQKFLKLRSDYVQNLSKNITAFFYTTLSNKNIVYQQRRIEIIVLLKNLCCNGEHIKIDDTNYDCFVRCLSYILNPSSSIVPENNTLTLDNLNSSVILELRNFRNKLLTNKEKRIKFVDNIKERDRLKYANNSLFDSDYSKLRGDIPSDFLHWLNNESSCIRGTKKSEPEKKINAVSKSQEFRAARLVLGYSLLNFSKTGICLSVLCTILEQLNATSDLNCDETDFIEYIWENREKWTIKIVEVVLEHFKFVYERHFIILCRNVLQRNAPNEIPENCRSILNLSIHNIRLRKDISNLCYELFAYSNYNKFLYEFLTKNNLIG